MIKFVWTAFLVWAYWGIFIELAEAAFYGEKKNAQVFLGVSLLLFFFIIACIWN